MGGCWASNDTICKWMEERSGRSITKRHLIRLLGRLKGLGVVRQTGHCTISGRKMHVLGVVNPLTGDIYAGPGPKKPEPVRGSSSARCHPTQSVFSSYFSLQEKYFREHTVASPRRPNVRITQPVTNKSQVSGPRPDGNGTVRIVGPVNVPVNVDEGPLRGPTHAQHKHNSRSPKGTNPPTSSKEDLHQTSPRGEPPVVFDPAYSTPFGKGAKPPSPWGKDCATKLRQGLKAANKLNGHGRASMLSWGREFDLLQSEVQDKGEIEDTLQSYIQRLVQKATYCPQAFCGKTFRTKYSQILAHLERQGLDSVKITVTETAQRIADGLRDLDWPATTKLNQLPIAVQQSLDQYGSFFAKFNKAASKAIEADDDIRGFFEYVTEELTRPDHYVEELWFKSIVLPDIGPWTKWNGDLSKFVWTKNHPMFVRWGLRLAKAYDESPELWAILMEAVDA